MADLFIIFIIVLIGMSVASIASEGQCWLLDIVTLVAWFGLVIIIMMFIV
jgi:hypothetical protein